MLVRNTDSDHDRLFHVSCSNWESVVTASSPQESASVAFKAVRDDLGKAMFIAPSLIVVDISASCESFDMDSNTHVMYTPEVMADAGYHALSKTYDEIVKRSTEENSIDEIED